MYIFDEIKNSSRNLKEIEQFNALKKSKVSCITNEYL